MPRTIFLNSLFIIVICSSFLFHSNQNSEPLLENLNHYLVQSRQEKAYIHCDKPYYTAGDTIWLKAYLVRAFDHRPFTLSSNLNIDLVNSSHEIVASRTVKIEDGGAAADFSLQNDLPAGKYMLRAYTNWMRNFDSAFYYRKPLWIAQINPEQISEIAKPEPDYEATNDHLRNDTLDVQFFPEGGDLVTGLPVIVAFKATKNNGVPEDISGRIIDQTGNTVTSLKTTHDGMGAFLMVPEVGNTYSAKITCGEDSVIYPLPSVQAQGYAISVINNFGSDEVKVIIRTNKQTRLKGGYLLGHTLGRVFYSAYIQEDTKDALFKIEKGNIVPGIATFTFFDSESKPQLERLTFTGQDSLIIKPELITKNKTPGTREKMSFQLIIEDTSKANVSVTVTNASVVKREKYSDNIISYLHLSSDLRGHIHNPYYYFEKLNTETHRALDLLLMTHGWRRFTWKDVNDGFQAKYIYEDGFLIKGQIKNYVFRNKPVSGIVQLASFENGLQMLQTESSEDGYFYFPNLDIRDTTTFILQAKKEKNNKNSYFIDYQKDDPPVVYDFPIPDYKYQKPSEEFVDKSEELFQILQSYKGHEKTIILEEIEVRERRQDDIYNDAPGNIYGHPDHRIIIDSLPGGNVFPDIFILLSRVPGVMVSGNSVSIRGGGTPLFLLDGIPLNGFGNTSFGGPGSNTSSSEIPFLQSINTNDIAFIDVLKSGASSAIYGGRGGNGVIAIYTRSGGGFGPPDLNREIPGIINVKHPGYYQAREFYSPKYTGDKEEEIMPDRRITLYWNPKVILLNGESEELTFYTSDEATTYDIIIEGISNNGKPVYGKYEFNTGI